MIYRNSSHSCECGGGVLGYLRAWMLVCWCSGILVPDLPYFLVLTVFRIYLPSILSPYSLVYLRKCRLKYRNRLYRGCTWPLNPFRGSGSDLGHSSYTGDSYPSVVHVDVDVRWHTPLSYTSTPLLQQHYTMGLPQRQQPCQELARVRELRFPGPTEAPTFPSVGPI